MKKRFVFLFLLITSLMVGITYGALIYKKRIFPYKHVEKAYSTLTGFTNPWTVGIYTGSTPFDLNDPQNVSNPVLTREDITDVDALFIADPFMIVENKEYNMFFEVLNRETNQGDIGLAKSRDGVNWQYQKIVLDEPFHLSYPYIFSWDNNYYLIPESGEDMSVRLYKAASFPDKWEYVGDLLSGHTYIDPSIFHYKGMWWLFTYTYRGILNLYYSEDLLKGWRPHPQNPIVKFDKNISRPAGRVFNYEGRLYRLAQSGIPRYGSSVFAFEITDISKESYEEKIASEKPIITFTGKGWNAGRMHHVDLHKLGDRWIGAVDGRNR